MGDRANIGIRQESGDIIWVYAHWNFMPGHAAAVAGALSASESRWGDESYANRLALEYLLQGGASGVSVNVRDDNEHKMFVIDQASQTVSLYPEWDGNPANTPEPIYTSNFKSFIERNSK